MGNFIWAMVLVLASTMWVGVAQNAFRAGDTGYGFASLGVAIVIAVLAGIRFKEGVDESIKKKVGK